VSGLLIATCIFGHRLHADITIAHVDITVVASL
jgi:hypothetical protein